MSKALDCRGREGPTEPAQLCELYGFLDVETADVVRLYVGYLRRKIELDPRNPKLIGTSRGFGYRYRKP